jgi:hypothetical protein
MVKEDVSMRKTAGLTILSLTFALSLAAAPPAERSFELSVFGGRALSQADGKAVHEDTWNFHELTRVWERTDIQVGAKKPFLCGAEAVAYFNRRFGVGLSFSAWKTDVDPRSDFRFEFSRQSGAGDSRSASWSGSGNLSGWAIGLNTFYRLDWGRFRAYVTAGPAVFRLRLDLAAFFGGGLTDTAETVHPPVDAIKIPISVAGESTSALGFNLGAGIIVPLGARLGLVLDVRYFVAPEMAFNWTIPAGRFDGIFYQDQIRDVYLSAEELGYVLDHGTLTPLRYRPSQFQIRVGIKLGLG